MSPRPEFRVHFIGYDESDREQVLPQYVNLVDPAVYAEIAALGVVRANRLSEHTSGQVVETWSGHLTDFDEDARCVCIGGRWAGEMRLDRFWLDLFPSTMVKTAPPLPPEVLANEQRRRSASAVPLRVVGIVDLATVIATEQRPGNNGCQLENFFSTLLDYHGHHSSLGDMPRVASECFIIDSTSGLPAPTYKERMWNALAVFAERGQMGIALKVTTPALLSKGIEGRYGFGGATFCWVYGQDYESAFAAGIDWATRKQVENEQSQEAESAG